MLIIQTHKIIFQYPDDYVSEYEFCKTKDDRWIHKSTDTHGSVYELNINYCLNEQTEGSE